MSRSPSPGARLRVVQIGVCHEHAEGKMRTLRAMPEDFEVIGVVENMAYLDATCPHCGQTHRIDVFGTGGGEAVSAALSTRVGYEVPVLAEIPLEPAVREAGDTGVPLVALDSDAPAARAFDALAERLASRARGLAGRNLGLHVR